MKQNKKQCMHSNKNESSLSAAEEEDRKMRKLFVDKLNASITEDDIYAVFCKHGEIEEVAKYQDRRAPQRYFAFVVYKYAKDCVKATHNPCPIIRGRKCACMLAAIGKQFSGYKFFVQKGLLTEEEKQNMSNAQEQNKSNNSCNGHSAGNKRHNNNNKKHNNVQQRARHNHKQNNNMNNNIKEQHSGPQIHIPSFKDESNSHHSSRSAIVSNTSFEDASPINYDMNNYPSWQSHNFDSHTSQCSNSYSTIASEQQQQLPPNQTTLLPSYHRESKSLHSNASNTSIAQQQYQQQQRHYNSNNNNNNNYNRRDYVSQKSLYKGLQHTQSNVDPRYRSNSYNNNNNNTPYMQYKQQSNPTWTQYNQQRTQYYAQNNYTTNNNNNNNNRRRTQSMNYYNTQQQPQPQPQSLSYSQMHLQPQQARPKYSLSPQLHPTNITPIQACNVPNMRQSVSYGRRLEHSRSYNNIAPMHKLHHNRNHSNIQQMSAPRLPLLPPKTQTVSVASVVKHASINRSHSARSSIAHSSHSATALPDIDIPCPDLLLDDFDIEVGLTPSPPPCLLLNSAAKPSIDIDKEVYLEKLQIPQLQRTFNNLEDAKKASDQELEAGFTMLASPTPSVHTEYNDNENDNENDNDNDGEVTFDNFVHL